MALNSELSAGNATLLSSTPAVKDRSQEISPNDYARFCTFLEKHTGIVLGHSKEYLIKNRLRNILSDTQEKSFTELLNVLEREAHNTLRTRVIDAMTTNETLWFRDNYPFDILKETLLPALAKKQGRPIRIWSAASSTGQEAYSICIAISEYLGKKPSGLPQGYEVVATDISETALNQARQGSYDNYDVVRGLTGHHQDKYFIGEVDQDISTKNYLELAKQGIALQ